MILSVFIGAHFIVTVLAQSPSLSPCMFTVHLTKLAQVVYMVQQQPFVSYLRLSNSQFSYILFIHKRNSSASIDIQSLKALPYTVLVRDDPAISFLPASQLHHSFFHPFLSFLVNQCNSHRCG
ncbi:hypothetical protein CI102_4060 [Trichoderma harzianum]|nr:hypothetical protein CI102_4060 [Trichoderma harzianum]